MSSCYYVRRTEKNRQFRIPDSRLPGASANTIAPRFDYTMLHRAMPSVTTRPCPADARTALEHAGLAPPWARLYAARGVTHPEQIPHPLPHLVPAAGLQAPRYLAP